MSISRTSVAVAALRRHMTRYRRSLTNYAQSLAGQPPD